MASYNKVILIGNLTRDPQTKHLPSNMVVAEFGLAVNRKFRTAGGEDREETAFVDCTAFGKQAEVISQYCQKGKPLFVEGRLKYDTWEDKAGNGKRSKLTVVVENFQFLPRAGDDSLFGGPGHKQSDMFGDPRPARSQSSSSNPGNDRSERSGEPNGEPAKAGGEARPARRSRKAASQPFGEEKQFEEADIPF